MSPLMDKDPLADAKIVTKITTTDGKNELWQTLSIPHL